ncbi:uncharacterized protein LOC123402764 isoform X5 [Hordeum vulgare subsp. vulgare]|uniref:uncharacterized protein LOC123402764 isoform X5 n=1 Tax=Hordeum vulgare subsp. vulgare TaxID=112509 RepID=UPI001D1A55C2|nr:uncharacterized protein LOC123402764 isoform X5 [Hordeum vulgare subsp. vulgare]
MSPAAATREQATVIANSTNFRVQSYYGDGKNPRDHGDWETEMGESEGAIFRNDSLDTYCQSDGAQPYLVNIQFQKKVQLQGRRCSETRIFLHTARTTTS